MASMAGVSTSLPDWGLGGGVDLPLRLAGGVGRSPEIDRWESIGVEKRIQEGTGTSKKSSFVRLQRDCGFGDRREEEEDSRAKRTRIVSPLESIASAPPVLSNSGGPVCQVDGCRADLTGAKDYHRRHKVCEIHSKAATVMLADLAQRFCQQCSRFHTLAEFDDGKRSCRRRLLGHNRRRRKVQLPAEGLSNEHTKLASDDGPLEKSQAAGDLKLAGAPSDLSSPPSSDSGRGRPASAATSAGMPSLHAVNQLHEEVQQTSLHRASLTSHHAGREYGEHFSQQSSPIQGVLQEVEASHSFQSRGLGGYQQRQVEAAAQGSSSQMLSQSASGQLDILQQMQAVLQQRHHHQQQQQREQQREQLLGDPTCRAQVSQVHRLFPEEHKGGQGGGLRHVTGETMVGRLDGLEMPGLLQLLKSPGQEQTRMDCFSHRQNTDVLSSLTQEQAAALMSGSLGSSRASTTRSLLELLRHRRERMVEQEGEGGGEGRVGSLLEMLARGGSAGEGRDASSLSQEHLSTGGSPQNWQARF